MKEKRDMKTSLSELDFSLVFSLTRLSVCVNYEEELWSNERYSQK